MQKEFDYLKNIFKDDSNFNYCRRCKNITKINMMRTITNSSNILIGGGTLYIFKSKRN